MKIKKVKKNVQEHKVCVCVIELGVDLCDWRMDLRNGVLFYFGVLIIEIN